MFEFLKDKKGEPPALPEGTVRRRYSIEGQVQGALIQRSDYIQITAIRQKDIAPDPWERGFSVRGY